MLNPDIEMQVVSDFYQGQKRGKIQGCVETRGTQEVFSTHLERVLSFAEIRDFSEFCLGSECSQHWASPPIPQLFSLFCVLHVLFASSFSLAKMRVFSGNWNLFYFCRPLLSYDIQISSQFKGTTSKAPVFYAMPAEIPKTKQFGVSLSW